MQVAREGWVCRLQPGICVPWHMCSYEEEEEGNTRQRILEFDQVVAFLAPLKRWMKAIRGLALIQGYGLHYWCASQCIQLRKPNRKNGAAGIQLFHLLCPMGRSIFKAIWERGNFPGDFCIAQGYGFPYHKSTQSAVAHLSTLLWRLKKTSNIAIFKSYGCSNAFPSISHECLTWHVDRLLSGQEVWLHNRLVQSRHQCSMVMVPGPEDFQILMLPGSGGCQADFVMPAQFMKGYGPVVGQPSLPINWQMKAMDDQLDLHCQNISPTENLEKQEIMLRVGQTYLFQQSAQTPMCSF